MAEWTVLPSTSTGPSTFQDGTSIPYLVPVVSQPALSAED